MPKNGMEVPTKIFWSGENNLNSKQNLNSKLFSSVTILYGYDWKNEMSMTALSVGGEVVSRVIDKKKWLSR